MTRQFGLPVVTALALALLVGTACRSHSSEGPTRGPVVARQSRPGPPRPQQPPPTAQVQRTQQPAPPPLLRASSGNPAWFPRGGISRRWTTIVIHHSATSNGNAAIFDRGHRQNGWDELGYHFVIGNGHGSPDGYIEVGGRWQKQKHGAHCKTPGNYFNDHGIGICLVGDFTKSQPTRAQMQSLQQLVSFLSSQCNIPASRITTHKDVTGKTACPGNRFPLAWLRASTSNVAHATSLPR